MDSKKKKSTKVIQESEFIKNQFEVIECLNKANNEIKKAFEIEMNCKNQVYGYILEKGHFDDYREYSKQNPTK